MEKIQVTRFSFRRKGSNRTKEKKEELLEQQKFDFDRLSYISQEEARLVQEEYLGEYAFSMEQLTELSGLSATAAIAKVYPKDTLSKDNGAILVFCGPGKNGGDGLVCARHLKLLGYKPTIFYPRQSTVPLFRQMHTQCEKMDIPFLSYLPSEASLIRDSYNLIVDALFGFNFVPPLKPEFTSILDTMTKCGLPIASLDIPSGWDVDNGSAEGGIQPDLLISLFAPKKCSQQFRGRHHYLGGRCVPADLAKKFLLCMPPYPGSEYCVELKIKRVEEEKSKDEKEDKENHEKDDKPHHHHKDK